MNMRMGSRAMWPSWGPGPRKWPPHVLVTPKGGPRCANTEKVIPDVLITRPPPPCAMSDQASCAPASFVGMGLLREKARSPSQGAEGGGGPEQAWGFFWGLGEAGNSLKTPLAPELTQAILISAVPVQAPPRPPPSPPGPHWPPLQPQQRAPRQPQRAVKQSHVHGITLLPSPTMAPQCPPQKTQVPPRPTKAGPAHQLDSSAHPCKTPPAPAMGHWRSCLLCAECSPPPDLSPTLRFS